MDVVKTNIEKIGGTVDMKSKVGEGTTLRVRIPLTLAIIPALTILAGGHRFAIPQVNLLELVRLDGESAQKGVERIKGAPVYRLRGNLLPLVYLHEELKIASQSGDGVVNIVVLQANERHFGLVVDGIRDTEEIVVKPLGKQLKDVSAFAGATIMGDGKVALILDVMGLAQSARVVTETSGRALAGAGSEDQALGTDRQSLLIFALEKGSRMAIPLDMVARLEEFKRADVERTGDMEVVQYRGEIMPLIHLASVFNNNGGDTTSESETMQAVVYTHDGKSVGLVVEQILDIVEETIEVKRSFGRKGVLGSVVVQGRVTDLLDVDEIMKTIDHSIETVTAIAERD
jgi:two-component system chemotaxis sensor kinase CheA